MRFGFLAFLFLVRVAFGADLFIDKTNGVDDSDCGNASGVNACKTWSAFINTGCAGSGCNASAGQTVHVAAGTYPERWTIPFDGTSSQAVTVLCDSIPNCIITGTGAPAYTNMTGCGYVMFGTRSTSTSSCSSTDSATYVKFVGFTVENVPTGATNRFAAPIANAGGATVNHVVIRDTIVDGTNLTDNGYSQVALGGGGSFKSVINSTVRNCKSTGGACIGFDQGTDNVAVIGNTVGPFNTWPVVVNTDCIQLQNMTTALIDGNTLTKCGDGVDIGINGSSNLRIKKNIIRYNDIKGCQGTGAVGKCIKISADDPSLTTGMDHAVYKNLIHPFDASTTNDMVDISEFTQYSSFAYNTIFNVSAANQQVFWMNELVGNHLASVNHIDLRWNIFASDGTTGTGQGPVIGPDNPGGAGTPTDGCAAQSCPWIGNQFDFVTGNKCVNYAPSDGSDVRFDCTTAALGTPGTCESGTFNTGYTENTCNYYGGASFLARGTPGTSSNLKLTSGSSGRDKGEAFCHTTISGSGTTINNLTCTGNFPIPPFAVGDLRNDPRHFFPDPANYYDVQNTDCAGKGARANEVNGANLGCFDIMIEGCAGTGGLGNITGVRTITSMTATSISFTGQTSCSWGANAKVHVPYEGSAPDLGALEFNSSATTTASTTTATTSTVSTTSGTATTTTAPLSSYG